MTPFDARGVTSTRAPAGDSVSHDHANPRAFHVARIDLLQRTVVGLGIIAALGQPLIAIFSGVLQRAVVYASWLLSERHPCRQGC